MTSITTAQTQPERPVDFVIGENVHRLMWRNQDTQKSIGQMLGLTQSALSLKLRGKRPWFASEIDQLAKHYRKTRDELFTQLLDLDSNQEPIGKRVAPVSQLEAHRAAKMDAHHAVAEAV